jgi:hypothetical protein
MTDWSTNISFLVNVEKTDGRNSCVDSTMEEIQRDSLYHGSQGRLGRVLAGHKTTSASSLIRNVHLLASIVRSPRRAERSL